MTNVLLLVEYDGAHYGGWQRQENALTIQQVLEDAVFKLTGVRTEVIGAGRTDAGVHAHGMVANFRIDCPIPAERFAHAFASVLPRDISVLRSQAVHDSFHARYDAKGKHYRYAILNRDAPPALLQGRCWHIRKNLDVQAMAEGAKHFLGTHDFNAFRAQDKKQHQTVKTLYESCVRMDDGLIYYNVKGNGFLYNMVRILTGTLVYCGLGKIDPDSIPRLLLEGKRMDSGATAPACGLYLEEVYYDFPLFDGSQTTYTEPTY